MLEKTFAETLRTAGLQVAEWLNSPPSFGHPVTKLIMLTQEMIHSYEHGEGPFERDDFERYQKRINRIARRYPLVRAVRGLSAPRPDSAFFPIMSMSPDRDALACTRIVNDVANLAEGGALWRIRRCKLPSCDRAFYARVQHQLFDTDACKQKWKASQPRFKRARAKYMKKRYHDKHYGLSSTRRRKR